MELPLHRGLDRLRVEGLAAALLDGDVGDRARCVDVDLEHDDDGSRQRRGLGRRDRVDVVGDLGRRERGLGERRGKDTYRNNTCKNVEVTPSSSS
ncbi:MAG: hypothetical protein ACHREM_25920 [Polyangiales bacterium]